MKERESVQAYEVRFEMVYKTKEGPRGTGMNIIFMSPDECTAILDAVGWAKGRMDALKGFHEDASFGAISVAHHGIAYYDSESRMINTLRGISFFEWKSDYPAPLADYIVEFQNKYKQKPYLTTQTVEEHRVYNPDYGDDRICKCGHSYYRHFDTYEKMLAVGCKYCGCYTFLEATPEDVCDKCKGHWRKDATPCEYCNRTGINPEVSKQWIESQSGEE